MDRLSIAAVTVDPVFSGEWVGQFEDRAGATGALGNALVFRSIARMGGLLARTGKVVSWGIWDANEAGATRDYREFYAFEVWDAGLDTLTSTGDGLTLFSSASLVLSPAAHPVRIGDEVSLFTADQWDAFFRLDG